MIVHDQIKRALAYLEVGEINSARAALKLASDVVAATPMILPAEEQRLLIWTDGTVEAVITSHPDSVAITVGNPEPQSGVTLLCGGEPFRLTIQFPPRV